MTTSAFAIPKSRLLRAFTIGVIRPVLYPPPAPSFASTTQSTGNDSIEASEEVPAVCMQGRRMWCHFGQRVERPGFVKSVVTGARGHYDETFSYVVMRRGPREPKVGKCCARFSWVSGLKGVW